VITVPYACSTDNGGDTVEISQTLLDALEAGGRVEPGETMAGRLECRLPANQNEALSALAEAMNGDKTKRSIAAREVMAAGFKALGREYARQMARQQAARE
jgi:hypothetical protein